MIADLNDALQKTRLFVGSTFKGWFHFWWNKNWVKFANTLKLKLYMRHKRLVAEPQPMQQLINVNDGVLFR
jgi:hypothetical protein